VSSDSVSVEAVALEALPSAALLLDDEGRIVAANAHATRLLGQELPSRSWRELLVDEDRTRLEGVTLPPDTEVLSLELRVGAPGGPRRMRLRLQRIASGGAVCLVDDVEREHAQAEARERALREAESRSRMKTQFLANMSHEIRTPMNAIIGMTELLRQTPLGAEQHRYVGILRSAGDHLLGLINHILDLSSVEAGRLQVEPIDFALRELVDGTVEMMLPRARQKALELVCQVHHDVPDKLTGDARRLRQILVNLLGNAVKFTEQGRVVLSVERDPRGREPATLRFTVEDTGPGIPESEREAIFERFARVETTTLRREEGSGLGLSITRKLVELLGGNIWVESEVGRGSRFRFTARFTEARGELQGRPSASLSLPGVRALVVADDPTSRIVMREMIVDWGGAVVEASGSADVDRELAMPGDFSVVVIDGSHLDVPALELAHRVTDAREDPPPVILAIAEPVDPVAAEAAGVTARLIKPLRRRDLGNAILAAVDGRSSWSSTETTLPPVASRRLRILAVDDAPDNRLLVQGYLRDQPHELELAVNGAEAVERFKERIFDVVLMDIQMPVMDGHAATRAMRRLETERGRPPAVILALTADAMPVHVEAALAAGCTSHLAKPLRRHALLVALALASKTHGPAQPSSPDHVIVEPLIADLVPSFMEGRRRDLAAIDAGLADGDLESIAVIGHTIKGVAASYGFLHVGELGAALEAHARVGAKDRIRQCRDELAAHLQRVSVEIRK